MALPNSGLITLDDIAGEFGGVAPHGLQEYLGVAAGVPASVPIGLHDFYGASAIGITPEVINYVSIPLKYHSFTFTEPTQGAVILMCLGAFGVKGGVNQSGYATQDIQLEYDGLFSAGDDTIPFFYNNSASGRQVTLDIEVAPPGSEVVFVQYNISGGTVASMSQLGFNNSYYHSYESSLPASAQWPASAPHYIYALYPYYNNVIWGTTSVSINNKGGTLLKDYEGDIRSEDFVSVGRILNASAAYSIANVGINTPLTSTIAGQWVNSLAPFTSNGSYFVVFEIQPD